MRFIGEILEEPGSAFDVARLGTVQPPCGKHLTTARNRSRRAASRHTSTSVFQSIMPAISSNKPYRIGRAATGLGLFATKPIKKGTRIVRYFGPLLDCDREEDDAIENKYLF